MLDLLFPRSLDNGYRGRRLALWLFVPILAFEALIGTNSMINTRTVAIGADGIPVDSYGAAGAAQVLQLFALLGLGRLLLALQGLLVLIRYRAAIPLAYLSFLLLHLGSKVVGATHPVVKTSAAAASSGTIGVGSAIMLGLLAALVVGFVLSLVRAPARSA